MTAQILNIRDYQNKKDIQRLYEEVTAEMMAIAGPVEIENVELIGGPNTFFAGEATIDSAPSEMGFPAWPCEPHYMAPEEDPA